jgi:6-phosphogluconolactonase (cycloisomerase 2 family)
MEAQPRSSPTQVYVSPDGTLVFSTEENGTLRAFELSADGELTEAPGSPVKLPDSLFTDGPRPRTVWPAGLSAMPDQPVLYTGIPNYGHVAIVDFSADGQVSFTGETRDPKASLPCWSVVSQNARYLYFANAGSNNLSVWNIAKDPHHPKLLQSLGLPGGGNPWGLRIDPSGRFLFVIVPRQVKQVPEDQGQLLHALRIQSDGTLAEEASSPVPLPVPAGSNPFGVAVVSDR